MSGLFLPLAVGKVAHSIEIMVNARLLVGVLNLKWALMPIFFMGSKPMREQELEALIEPTVEVLGFELWGLEIVRHGRRSMLRIYIEAEQGITVDDCAVVSRQVSGLLDVENPIDEEYTLEVSSPGIDRRIFKPSQIERCQGQSATVQLRQPFEGQKKFKGVLVGIEGSDLVLRLSDEEEIVLPFHSIERAKVQMPERRLRSAESE